VHLYIHVPFCARRCSYCDFAIAVGRTVPSSQFEAAILREWSAWQSHPAWAASPGLDTIYFGGGTPSRLDPASIVNLLARFRSDRPLAADAEITLEANPEDVTGARTSTWLEAGVNRISLGAQSFHPEVLAWMHRTHSAPAIGEAVAALRAAGVKDLSLDLIYGLPRVLRRNWAADLDWALELEPEHLSLYGLTVEPRTPLGRWTARGESTPVDEETAAREYLHAHDRLREHGFDHYEVSNAARPGFRARHNAAYWRRAPFIGLGPSAHSGLGDTRSWNVREWAAYRERSESGEPVLEASELLTPEQVALEDLYLGLRTSEGAAVELVPPTVRMRWCNEGWGRESAGRLQLTAEGWLRLDALVGSVAGR
jgi:oxygen-independent coproporphyrinogen-3 oxidase